MVTDQIGNINLSEVQRFAESEEGRKIIAMLSSDKSGRISAAVNQASQGNMNEAKRLMTQILADLDAKQNKTGGSYGK